MAKIYIPSQGPESWRALLADPEKHWEPGFSAKTLANCWEAANGNLPAEISELFEKQGAKTELLLALPEHKVPLPGSSRADSQNDVFAIIRAADRTFASTIEGKIDESFGEPLGQWFANPSSGKQERLAYICDVLGLKQPLPGDIYYQLLHRTAAAVIEARRFKTDAACMIVHSFSPSGKWYPAFEDFVSLFGIRCERGQLLTARPLGNPPLHLGWAVGDAQFREPTK